MDLPFSPDQFMQVFRDYNIAVWPAQIVAVLLVVICIGLARFATGDRLVSVLLAVLWLWMGLVYHIFFFSVINPAAYLFGGLFLVQGLLFIYEGGVHGSLNFRMRMDASGVLGLALIIYALIIYPLLGILAGHRYPSSPTFGLPCPTTIFTFGMFLWTSESVRWRLLVIPLLWSLMGLVAAFKLGMVEDLGLLFAGVTTAVVLWIRDRHHLKAHLA